jgi:hypothetical protein
MVNILWLIGYYLTDVWFWIVDRILALAIKLKCWNQIIAVKRMAKRLPKKWLTDPNDTIIDPYTNIAKRLREDWNKGNRPLILGSNTVTKEEEFKGLMGVE